MEESACPVSWCVWEEEGSPACGRLVRRTEPRPEREAKEEGQGLRLLARLTNI